MFGLVAAPPRYKVVNSCFLFAGIFRAPPRVRESVIPAKAGIQYRVHRQSVDSRFRGNDSAEPHRRVSLRFGCTVSRRFRGGSGRQLAGESVLLRFPAFANPLQ